MTVQTAKKVKDAPTTKLKYEKEAVDRACQYLEMHGAKVLERRWKHRESTVDIIASDDGTLVFVEVLGRIGVFDDLPKERRQTSQRRTRLERLVIGYLASHDVASCKVRFDVICINVNGHQAFLKHHRDAMSAGE